MNEQLLHDALLERLRTCSDSVMLALDQNGYEDRSLLKRLEPYYLLYRKYQSEKENKKYP